MAIKRGSIVSLMDEDLTGVVTSIKGGQASIKTEDGFEMVFPVSDLVLISEDLNFMDSPEFDLNEKEEGKRKPKQVRKGKEKFQPPMEVDLHIHQLTDKSGMMSNHDMLSLQLDVARQRLEFAIRNRIPKVVFIHGVGEGVLKLELEYLFGRYDNVKFYDANYQKYGLGATEVYIYQNTPTTY
ncbi:Smr/MutS family protein [Mangrovimonas futianensis]|uniref:Smr/MutS family protein n=2 Tax=Mangrovimonas futianensis TaxID=2895523 RepID=UPI001E559401|nr:DNA mismatch repair protein MutS [Mangrovimonas futianensis]